MQKTKTFRFVDDQQSWDFEITYNLPTIRGLIDFERQRIAVKDAPDASVQQMEQVLNFVTNQIVQLDGPVTEVEEMPAAWVIKVGGDMLGTEDEDSEGNG